MWNALWTPPPILACHMGKSRSESCMFEALIYAFSPTRIFKAEWDSLLPPNVMTNPLAFWVPVLNTDVWHFSTLYIKLPEPFRSSHPLLSKALSAFTSRSVPACLYIAPAQSHQWVIHHTGSPFISINSKRLLCWATIGISNPLREIWK